MSRRHRAQRGPQGRQGYALYQAHGAGAVLAAMALASQAGRYAAAARASLLARPQPTRPVAPLVLPGVPAQADLDRPLSVYEALVLIDEAVDAPATAPGATARAEVA